MNKYLSGMLSLGLIIILDELLCGYFESGIAGTTWRVFSVALATVFLIKLTKFIVAFLSKGRR